MIERLDEIDKRLMRIEDKIALIAESLRRLARLYYEFYYEDLDEGVESGDGGGGAGGKEAEEVDPRLLLAAFDEKKAGFMIV